MVILPKGGKPHNFEYHNSQNLALPIFEIFIRILLNVNLSLSQTLLTFLVSARQTWITQLILAISL